MTCPRCGRDVAANITTRGPDGRRLRHPIRRPAQHKRLLDNGTFGPICEPDKRPIGFLVRDAGL